MAVEFLRSHPEAIPELALRKLWRWLTPITNSGVRNQILVLASYGTLLVLLALGLVRGSIRPSQLLVGALAITVASCVITAVYWGNLTRGRMPIEIVWLPWASLAFCETFASTPRPTPGNAEAVPSTLEDRK
jgi:hypothetical protein